MGRGRTGIWVYDHVAGGEASGLVVRMKGWWGWIRQIGVATGEIRGVDGREYVDDWRTQLLEGMMSRVVNDGAMRRARDRRLTLSIDDAARVLSVS